MSKKFIDIEHFEQYLKSEGVSQKASKYEPLFQQGYLNGLNQARLELRSFPTADVQEVKHGEWWTESTRDFNGDYRSTTPFYCTWCGRRTGVNQAKTYNYCPYCGAKMDGDEAAEFNAEF